MAPPGLPTVIFQHIPKTAGSTLHGILNSRFRDGDVWNLFGGNFHDPEIQEFQNLPAERKHRIKLLKGHMPFGLHQFLPQPSWYMTIIRDPIRRVISQFFYIRRNVQNQHHDTVVHNDLSLATFLRSGESPGLENGQVRWLAGEIHAVPFGDCGESLFQTALDNCRQHYRLVIPTKSFDTGLLLLADELNWKGYPVYRRENVRRPREDPYEVSEEDLEAIREFNALDIRLYKILKREFEQLCQSRPELSNQVEKFKKLNSFYQAVTRPLSWIPGIR